MTLLFRFSPFASTKVWAPFAKKVQQLTAPPARANTVRARAKKRGSNLLQILRSGRQRVPSQTSHTGLFSAHVCSKSPLPCEAPSIPDYSLYRSCFAATRHRGRGLGFAFLIQRRTAYRSPTQPIEKSLVHSYRATLEKRKHNPMNSNLKDWNALVVGGGFSPASLIGLTIHCTSPTSLPTTGLTRTGPKGKTTGKNSSAPLPRIFYQDRKAFLAVMPPPDSLESLS